MRALWFDVFHEGTSIADADKEVLLEENTLAWKSNVEAMNTRFFPVIGDDDENIRGAVVHLQGFSDYPSMVAFTKTVPWIKHGVARGGIYPYGNFVSVQRLFGQNGKYRDVKLIERIQRFETSPTFTWYVVISARKTQLEDYDAQYGLDDALQCFRLLKGKQKLMKFNQYRYVERVFVYFLAGEVAEEVFDLHGPFEGKVHPSENHVLKLALTSHSFCALKPMIAMRSKVT